jgi:hypothetical protein
MADDVERKILGRCGCKERKWSNNAVGGICPYCKQKVKII